MGRGQGVHWTSPQRATGEGEVMRDASRRWVLYMDSGGLPEVRWREAQSGRFFAHHVDAPLLLLVFFSATDPKHPDCSLPRQRYWSSRGAVCMVEGEIVPRPVSGRAARSAHTSLDQVRLSAKDRPPNDWPRLHPQRALPERDIHFWLGAGRPPSPRAAHAGSCPRHEPEPVR